MTIFGKLVSGTDVEDAVIDTLEEWLPTYLKEIEQQFSVGEAIPMPRSYSTKTEFDKFAEDQVPTIIVTCPGTADKPVRDGNGAYRVSFALGVGALVSARDEEATDTLSKLYGVAIRAVLVQKSSLQGFASDTEWMEENYDPVPSRENRTLAGVTVLFRVWVDGVVSKGHGPLAPADPIGQPGSDWPEVETADVAITAKD